MRVFENRVLRRIFGPKGDEVTGGWRKLRNQEFNDLYCSPNIVRVIKWRRMKWAGHVARMGERRGVVYTGFWWGNLRERGQLEDRGLDGKIILRWIFRKWNVGWLLKKDCASWSKYGGQPHSFLTSAPDRCEQATSRCGLLTSGKESRQLLNKSLARPQSLSGRFGEISVVTAEIRTRDRPAHTLVTVPNEQYN